MGMNPKIRWYTVRPEFVESWGMIGLYGLLTAAIAWARIGGTL